MAKRHGIYVASKNLFYHSTVKAGVNHTPVLVSVDIPMSADNTMIQTAPTVNFSAETTINVGAAVADIRRAWLKPNFSSLPSNIVFNSALLKLTVTGDSSNNARTMYAHRCLPAAVNNQQTWNVYSTGNNWTTGGASSSGNDYEATEIGHVSVPASPPLNTQLTMTLTASELQKLYDGTYTNNGIVLFVDTQNDDAIAYASIDHATSAYRPIITIGYYI